MALELNTEEVSCDVADCDATEELNASIPKGWYFTVDDVENNIATYTDYCPTHANGRRRKNSDLDKPAN